MNKRDVSADIIRIFAFFLVVSMHFLGNIRFYDEIILGGRMYVMLLMRATFMICVPLFLCYLVI